MNAQNRVDGDNEVEASSEVAAAVISAINGESITAVDAPGLSSEDDLLRGFNTQNTVAGAGNMVFMTNATLNSTSYAPFVAQFVLGPEGPTNVVIHETAMKNDTLEAFEVLTTQMSIESSSGELQSGGHLSSLVTSESLMSINDVSKMQLNVRRPELQTGSISMNVVNAKMTIYDVQRTKRFVGADSMTLSGVDTPAYSYDGLDKTSMSFTMQNSSAYGLYGGASVADPTRPGGTLGPALPSVAEFNTMHARNKLTSPYVDTPTTTHFPFLHTQGFNMPDVGRGSASTFGMNSVSNRFDGHINLKAPILDAGPGVVGPVPGGRFRPASEIQLVITQIGNFGTTSEEVVIDLSAKSSVPNDYKVLVFQEADSGFNGLGQSFSSPFAGYSGLWFAYPAGMMDPSVRNMPAISNVVIPNSGWNAQTSRFTAEVAGFYNLSFYQHIAETTGTDGTFRAHFAVFDETGGHISSIGFANGVIAANEVGVLASQTFVYLRAGHMITPVFGSLDLRPVEFRSDVNLAAGALGLGRSNLTIVRVSSYDSDPSNGYGTKALGIDLKTGISVELPRKGFNHAVAMAIRVTHLSTETVVTPPHLRHIHLRSETVLTANPTLFFHLAGVNSSQSFTTSLNVIASGTIHPSLNRLIRRQQEYLNPNRMNLMYETFRTELLKQGQVLTGDTKITKPDGTRVSSGDIAQASFLGGIVKLLTKTILPAVVGVFKEPAKQAARDLTARGAKMGMQKINSMIDKAAYNDLSKAAYDGLQRDMRYAD